MRLIDWRDADPSLLSAIWQEQRARWIDRLCWDSAGNWAEVEAQRQAALLPGLILLDGDRLAAWSFFLLQHDTLQIGAFEAASPEATAVMLDAVLLAAAPDTAPSGAMLFALSDAPGLVPALSSRGFSIESYRYLVRQLTAVPPPTGGMDWTVSIAGQVPSLLARAYDAPTLTRPFARHGRDDEWRDYTAQLLGSIACGRFEPHLSAASVSSDGSLDAIILTTVVEQDTAHVAQLAVDPAHRARGLGAAMLGEVAAKAYAAGLGRLSLLVGEGNACARRLYARSGFTETARFVSAGRGVQPRLSTSPAFDTGGVSTFR